MVDLQCTYCIECGHMLVPNIHEYNFKYCGNRDCSRYGLYTGLIDTEPNPEKNHPKRLNLKKTK